ncbi:hypothetical protein Hanom_Chr11g01056961 [Helianthus anomalus]
MKSKSKTDKLWFLPRPVREEDHWPLFLPRWMNVKKDQPTWFSLWQVKRKKDEMLSANDDMLSNVAIKYRYVKKGQNCYRSFKN